MDDVIEFPPNLVAFASASWQIINVSRSGGRSITGTEQVVNSPAGNWVADIALNIGAMDWNGSRELLAYRGFLARLRGRAMVVAVPYNNGRGPSELLGLDITTGLPHSDDTFFDDDTGYLNGSIPVQMGASIGANETDILLQYPSFARPKAGQAIMFPDGRMHQIAQLLDNEGEYWTVRISPWTRAAYPAGTDIEVDRVTCLMRLASDEGGTLTVTAGEPWTSPRLQFVEAF